MEVVVGLFVVVSGAFEVFDSIGFEIIGAVTVISIWFGVVTSTSSGTTISESASIEANGVESQLPLL